MKQVQSMTENVWQDDRDILVCQGCEAAFSVARRKVQLLQYRHITVINDMCSDFKNGFFFSITVEIVALYIVLRVQTIQCS